MPYKNIVNLPDNIRNHLPIGAQKIYLEAFNHALVEYDEPSKRRDGSTLEVIAHKVAWSAVKKSYIKDKSGLWVKKK